YMKGRDNYLCIKRFREFESDPVFDQLSEVDFHRTLAAWGASTETGDRGELGDLPESFRAWDRINARTDTCLGQRCPDFEPCFLTQMRRRAAESQLVVVNHHLLMADLVLREHAFGQVIPDYSVLIVDEAHALEDVATSHLGRAVSSRQVQELADDTERALGAALDGRETERRRIDTLKAAAREFFALMSSRESSGSRFMLDAYRHDDLWLTAGGALRERLGRCETLLQQGDPDGDPALSNLVARARAQATTLDGILTPADSMPALVMWGE